MLSRKSEKQRDAAFFLSSGKGGVSPPAEGTAMARLRSGLRARHCHRIVLLLVSMAFQPRSQAILADPADIKSDALPAAQPDAPSELLPCGHRRVTRMVREPISANMRAA